MYKQPEFLPGAGSCLVQKGLSKTHRKFRGDKLGTEQGAAQAARRHWKELNCNLILDSNTDFLLVTMGEKINGIHHLPWCCKPQQP